MDIAPVLQDGIVNAADGSAKRNCDQVRGSSE